MTDFALAQIVTIVVSQLLPSWELNLTLHYLLWNSALSGSCLHVFVGG